MNRRQFMRGLVTASAFGLLSPPLSSNATRDDWQYAFQQALDRKPWLLGWQSPAATRFTTAKLDFTGKLPDALRGTFYRIGPARHAIGHLRYRHAFDGDGMVHAFRFTDHGISHTGRYVETEKYQQEIRAGKALQRGFGTALPGLPPAASPASVNVANTSVLSHADRVFALWEGGMAYALEPTTLDTIGPHAWSPETAGLPFSAHPKLERDGTVWNFGVAPWLGAMVLYHIRPSGSLANVVSFKVDRLGMVHDFVVTERHLVLVLPPLIYDPERAEAGQSYLDSHVWQPEQPSRILIVDKSNLNHRRWLEIPGQWVFHFGNAWEDPSGAIFLDGCFYDDPSVMYETLRYVMRGEWRESTLSHWASIVLHPDSGRVKTEKGIEHVEFPRIDPRRVGRRHRQSYLLQTSDQMDSSHPTFSTVARQALDTGQLDRFTYGPSLIAEEHIVAPNAATAQEGDGWLIGTSLDIDRRVTQVAVFNALHLSDGPIAVARLPYPLPLGLHGTFATH